ncbi:extracellular solute-binding protein [Brooklawnia cerclae]|uniref:Multiple sugar transport system substrate-binding protein n=1 Tax=Brooklawnia cerclae TaxID=349934 RepID=A0ABX0SPA5_9ACTN|nr:extracellular solute-binding protein [Brooklawnia cerclae]NIH58631.1 multiple sugar transport system substrate-binding protein [Brooklawnia cerclae]
MRRFPLMMATAAVTFALALSSCGGGESSGDGSEATGTLTLAGWSLASTPEFQTLADAFNATDPKYKVEVKEYQDGNNYDTQMVADLAAGTAPDIYVQKNLKNFYTYQDGEQLLDVSDVATELSDETGGLDAYEVDGKTWAIPYRQDAWVIFYNKDLFAKAGVAEPDGTWTWDDYVTAAEQLTAALGADGAQGAYQHSWQSVVQGFALAQTPGADLLSGDFSYLTPYYERSLALADAGAMPDYGTVTTNKLTYQAQFGKQKAALLPMGTWYIATLIAQQASGDADAFEWGIAPAPQYDESTTGTDNVPVTFADPTGLGINPALDEDKVQTAKDFLAFAAGPDGAKAMAGIGITPALTSDDVVDTFFATDGAPTDELSKFAFSTHEVKPENPVSEHTAAIQNLLNETHSAILSKSVTVDEGIADAEQRAQDEVLNK